MEHVEKTARSYAKRQYKSFDKLYIDECIAEAYFWLVILLFESKEEVLKHENPMAFVRMKIGYKLKEYWAPYATSTISYLKKKGKEPPKIEQYTDDMSPRENIEIQCFLSLESVLRLPLEREIYQYHIKCMDVKEIAEKLEIRTKRVQKILTRIRKRIQHLEQD